jgi:hypothetical protein
VKLGKPFTRWSVRKLAEYLDANPVRRVRLGRERLRVILREHGITFQRTRTWKEWTTPVILEAVGSGKDLRHGSGSEVPG